MMGNTPLPAAADRRHWLWIAGTLFSLLAFAANSIFCRLALRSGAIDPQSFTAIRLLGGSLFLLMLLNLGKRTPLGGSWRGAVSLFVYAYLFSLAYIHLDAGVGALILFGAVQISMFGLGWKGGEKLRARVALGMFIAFCGLLVLLAPGGTAPPLSSALAMVVAGIAWGVYSILGRGAGGNPLGNTAGNFLRSLPWVGVAVALGLVQGGISVSVPGVVYALASGVLASGAGYAVWYSVVGRMSAQTAATLQLSVPVLAALVGVLLLDEPLSLRLILASLIVLGGIALALTARRVPPGR